MTTEPSLAHFDKLIGTWTTEATHPAFPGVVVHGTAEISWLEGERFLIHRARTDHPDFPDSISILGFMDRARVDDARGERSEDATESRLRMHYFDSRGVFRVYDASIDATAWRLWRDDPGFAQRFSGTVVDDGNTVRGQWELRRDDVNWENDLAITYRRQR